MFCPRCGSEVPQGASFCVRCGWKVETSPEGGGAQGAQGAGGAASASDIARGAVSSVADKLNEMAGGTGHVELKFSNFFDAVPKHHTSEEAAELFACGSPSTTPRLADVTSEWPHPWLWSRVLGVLLAFLVLCVVMIRLGFNETGELMFIGSLATPLAALIFFYETNVFRNVNIGQVMKYFILGGVLSLVAVAIILNVFPDVSGTEDVVPSLMTGLFEEVAKFLVTAYILSRQKGRVPILNGLLMGAAVGAGFAAFETIGYVLQAFIFDVFTVVGSDSSVMQLFMRDPSSAALAICVEAFSVGNTTTSIVSRGLLAFGGHVAWAAVEGGALAAAESDKGFQWSDLTSSRFVGFTAICVVLHGVWDMDIPGLDDISLGVFGTPKYYLLIVVIWIVIAVLLNRGLEQANELSKQAAQRR